MKNKLLSILAQLVIYSLTAAQSFEGLIKFENSIIFKNKKDSSKHAKDSKRIREAFGMSPGDYDSYNSEAFIKTDSCLLVKYYFQPDTPDFYIISIKDKAFSIKLESGKEYEYNYYFKKFFPPFKKKNKVKTILGYECTLYRGEDDKQRNEIWVANNLKADTGLEAFAHYMYNGSVILEQTHYAKVPRFKAHTIVTEIIEQPIDNIFQRVKEYEKIDDREKMYADIEQNEALDSLPIKIGDILPNIYYRDVNTLTIKSLDNFKGNGKYLMLEFWGTWCAPCLKASPKIKEFYSANSALLDLLSFNWGDRTYNRVLELISKKEMNWNHAFGTKKLINMLNPPPHVPYYGAD